MQLDESLVRERAYTLWERDGAVHGRADHYWFQAEREIQAAVEVPAPTAHPNGVKRGRLKNDPHRRKRATNAVNEELAG
jgi:DUF2934 family protein